MSLKAEMSTLGGRYSLYTDQASANPASIANGAIGTVDWTITGLSSEDEIMGYAIKTALNGLVVNDIDCSSDLIRVHLENNTGGAVDLGAITANFLILKDPATPAS